MVFILATTLTGAFNSDEDLSKDANELERAVRFISDEAALRNSVVRIHFMLNKAPQEYAVEYGPNDSFILPPVNDFESKVLTKEEEEKLARQTKDTNLKFNKVQEFQESNTEISDNVKILGIGNSTSEKFMSTGDVSIYSFPTGEKDDALILIANEDMVVSLAVSPFNSKIERKNHKLEAKGNREINDLQNEKAKEIFETWLKER